MKIEQIKKGMKLSYWHHTYEGERGESSICLAEVLKVGKKKVRVRDEWGNEAWKYPSFFNREVPEETWLEITNSVPRLSHGITPQLLLQEQEALASNPHRYLDCLNHKLLKDRTSPQEIRDGLILFHHVYKT